MRFSRISLAALLSFLLQLAHAAPPPLAAPLAQTIGALARPLEGLPVPGGGTIGGSSLGSFPIFNLDLPLLGKGLPLVSNISVSDGVIILQSVSTMQNSLPGLGVLDAALSSAGSH